MMKFSDKIQTKKLGEPQTERLPSLRWMLRLPSLTRINLSDNGTIVNNLISK